MLTVSKTTNIFSFDISTMFEKPLDHKGDFVGLTENKNLTEREEKKLVAQRIQSLLELIKTQGKEDQSGELHFYPLALARIK